MKNYVQITPNHEIQVSGNEAGRGILMKEEEDAFVGRANSV
jgi:hypothetical protein